MQRDISKSGLANIKVQFAQRLPQVMNNFLGTSVKGKKILDVGTGAGINAASLSNAGADVYAVEPKKEALQIAVEQGYVDADKAFPIVLQDLPDEHKGSFDVVTAFLWKIPYAERDAVCRSLGEAIKPDGKIFIGAADDVYVDPRSDIYLGQLFFRHFHETRMIKSPDGYQTFFVCSKPRVEPLPVPERKYSTENARGLDFGSSHRGSPKRRWHSAFRSCCVR